VQSDWTKSARPPRVSASSPRFTSGNEIANIFTVAPQGYQMRFTGRLRSKNAAGPGKRDFRL
jgi:hypothetical protein